MINVLEVNLDSISENKTLITVFPPISVFLTVYPSQCVPYKVSQQGSSLLRTVNFFISLSFIVIHQILKGGFADRGTFTGVSEEGTPNIPFAQAT